MANIYSMTALMAQVAESSKGWSSMADSEPCDYGMAALTIVSLGSHIIRSPVHSSDPVPEHTSMRTHGDKGLSYDSVHPPGGKSDDRHPLIVEDPREGSSTWELSPNIIRSQEALARSHELLQVLPWPLRYRAMCVSQR
jgi:hypothetical protein